MMKKSIAAYKTQSELLNDWEKLFDMIWQGRFGDGRKRINEEIIPNMRREITKKMELTIVSKSINYPIIDIIRQHKFNSKEQLLFMNALFMFLDGHKFVEIGHILRSVFPSTKEILDGLKFFTPESTFIKKKIFIIGRVAWNKGSEYYIDNRVFINPGIFNYIIGVPGYKPKKPNDDKVKDAPIFIKNLWLHK